MASRYVEVEGTIDINQFYPKGTSDADTIKLTIPVNGKKNFKYVIKATKTKPETITYLDGFYDTPGTNDKAFVKYEGRKNQYISIRVDSIDSTELHYKFYDTTEFKPEVLNKKFLELNKPEYRQNFSKRAVQELVFILSKYADANGIVKAVFINDSISNDANSITDIYSRFLGKVLINDRKINLGIELLKKGLVFPALYTSHTLSNMKYVLATWEKMKTNVCCNVNKSLRADMLKFDYKLIKDDYVVYGCNDHNYVNLPKFYRRWCLFNIMKDSGNFNGTWKEYLLQDPDDNFVFFKDIKEYKSLKDKTKFTKYHHLSELFDDANKFIGKIEELVFI